MRKFATSHCAKNNVGDAGAVSLKAASKAGAQFDCCARVLAVHELDQYHNELKLRDGSGEVFYTLAL